MEGTLKLNQLVMCPLYEILSFRGGMDHHPSHEFTLEMPPLATSFRICSLRLSETASKGLEHLTMKSPHEVTIE